jgi:hypothetical protein
MEPEGSLPHSKLSATRLYPESAVHTPYANSWRSNLLVYFHEVSPPKPCTRLPPPRYLPCPSNSSRFYHPHNIGWEVQIMKFLIMKFSRFNDYRFPLRHKYSLQQSILKHPQPMFLTQGQRPSFTPIQNKRQDEKFLQGILIFKGLAAWRFYKSFCFQGLTGLVFVTKNTNVFCEVRLYMERRIR